MKMKKLMITGCVAAMLFLVPSQKNSWLYAADFEGNEEAWLNKWNHSPFHLLIQIWMGDHLFSCSAILTTKASVPRLS